jgi:hypothetical protein
VIVLEEAIGIYEETCKRRAESLSDLGNALYHFCLAHNIKGIRSYCHIELFHERLRLRVHGCSLHDQSLHSLTRSLLDTRYLQLACLDILLEWASLSREDFWTRPPGHTERLKSLDSIAMNLGRMTCPTSDMGMQAQIVSLPREILRMRLPSHSIRQIPLNNLGAALVVREVMQLHDVRYPQRFAVVNNQPKNLMHKREAMELLPDSHQDRDRMMSDFADVLLISSRRFEAGNALTEGTFLLREVVIMQFLGVASQNNIAPDLSRLLEYIGDIDIRTELGNMRREILRFGPPGCQWHDISLSNLCTTVYVRFERLGGFEILAKAPSVLQKAIKFWTIDHGRRVIVLKTHESALVFCSVYEGYMVLLSEASNLHRKFLQLLPDRRFCQAMKLCNLVDSLLFSFREGRDVETLSEAIRRLRQAVSLQTSTANCHRKTLALALRSIGRWCWFRSLESVLGKTESCSWLGSVSCHQDILRVWLEHYSAQVRLLSGIYNDANTVCVVDYVWLVSLCFPTVASPHRPVRDIGSSAVHGRKHEANTVISCTARVHLQPDMFDATSLGRSPTCLTSIHSDLQAETLKFLADARLEIYPTSHFVPALEKAISTHEVLQLRVERHNRRAEALTNISDALHRFRCDQEVHETRGNRSIVCLREAFHLRPPGHLLRDQSLHNLARSLWSICCERLGDLDILGGCVSRNREALQFLPLGHLEHSNSIDSLPGDLHMIVDCTCSVKIVAQIVCLRREVLLMHTPGHPLRLGSLHYLSIALCISFGDLGACAETITMLRLSMKLLPMRNPERCMVPDTLGSPSLRSLYEQLSESCWEPIALLREALRLWPVKHSRQAGYTCHLAKILGFRARDSGDKTNALAEVISLLRQMGIMNLQSLRSYVLGIASITLAEALEANFDIECDRDTEALSEAATLFRHSPHLYPLEHLQRFWPQGLCKSRAHPWLEAFASYQEVLRLHAMGGLGRAPVLSKMEKCFLDPSSTFCNLTKGIACLSEAYADTLSHVNRRVKLAIIDFYQLEVAYDASKEGSQAMSHGQHDKRIVALHAKVIGLLPEAENFGLDHGARLRAVAGYDEIVRNAAARAVLSGCLLQAVAMLEQGRGLFWTQTVRLRTAMFDGVPKNDCHELQCILRLLDHDVMQLKSLDQSTEEGESELERRRQLNDAVQTLILKIRGYPGFECFLLPPTFDTLLDSLPDGFVVIVNTSRRGHHALLLQRATRLATSLALQIVCTGFDSATLQAHIPRARSSEHRTMRVDRGRGRRYQDVLASLWISIVKPIFDVLGIKVSNKSIAVFAMSDRIFSENARARSPTTLVVRDGTTRILAYTCRWEVPRRESCMRLRLCGLVIHPHARFAHESETLPGAHCTERPRWDSRL